MKDAEGERQNYWPMHNYKDDLKLAKAEFSF